MGCGVNAILSYTVNPRPEARRSRIQAECLQRYWRGL